jgi:prepilin-type N-terminal cleavage/methylation domain-containing protein
MSNTKKGFTLVELLVVMAIIALLLGLLLPALAKARATARQVKDQTQVKQVHTGLLTAANDTQGVYPLPGEINRAAVPGAPGNGQIPGRGNIDETVNQHANLWGAMIGRNFLSAQIMVSPAESNGKVIPATTYNNNIINPAADIYWDNSPTSFKCDLTNICNTSYATMPIDNSSRRRAQWRNTGDSRFAVLGNRGTRGGAITGTPFTASKTLEIHGGRNEWDGNTAYNDNHVDYGRTFFPENLRTVGTVNPPILDNLFRNDAGSLAGAQRNTDCWLVMQRTASGTLNAPNVTIDSAEGGDFVTWD